MQRSFELAESKILSGLRGYVYGAGPLGLFTAFALARNGAEVTIAASEPIDRGIGFVNAAGLIEPVASADPRAADFLISGMRFCAWAERDPEWGVTPRSVLFLSDDEERVKQDWMVQLSSYRRATAEEIEGRRSYGAWFETFVIQPNIAINAINREMRGLGIQGVKPITVKSAGSAAKTARDAGADFFVLALGLGLAEIKDIEHVAGVNAMLSAGVGVTVVMPYEKVGLDHVIMDDVDLGYLIPQRTQVIGGGTNFLHAYDDDEARASAPDSDLVELVRAKFERLWPQASGVPGVAKIGSRPLRAGGHVLTATLEPPEMPLTGLLLGGAGGSGWTFAVGIADSAVRELAERFDRGDPSYGHGSSPLVPPGYDESDGLQEL